MNSAARIGLLGAIGVILAGLAVWRYAGKQEETVLPDTAASTTEWICETCKNITNLTSKQVNDWVHDPQKARYGPQYDRKQTVFKCDKCNTYTVVRAIHCNQHDIWFPYYTSEGADGRCPKCPK